MFNVKDVPDELKHIQPYIQRGQEMQQVDPVVSYFCKYYAARLSISSSTSPASQGYLTSLLDLLESEKQSLQSSPLMADEATASQHCTTFALKVFAKADNEDRQPGGSNKVTARNFVVSTQFMQVLAGFGELSEEIKEKIKYAKWRAAEILKAIREGREPAGPPKDVEEGNELKPGDVGAWPSPPSDSQRNSADVMSPSPSIAQQQQQQQQVSASASPQWSTGTAYPNANPLGSNSHGGGGGGGGGGVARAFDDAVLPTVPKSNVYGEGALQSPGFHSQPQQQHQAGRSSSAVPQISTPVSAAAFIPVPASNLPALTGPDGELLLDPTDAKNAQKFSRWAISALEYDDVDTAIENLQKAIQILLPYRK